MPPPSPGRCIATVAGMSPCCPISPGLITPPSYHFRAHANAVPGRNSPVAADQRFLADCGCLAVVAVQASGDLLVLHPGGDVGDRSRAGSAGVPAGFLMRPIAVQRRPYPAGASRGCRSPRTVPHPGTRVAAQAVRVPSSPRRPPVEYGFNVSTGMFNVLPGTQCSSHQREGRG
jgi:hypothetical protein